ncbi:hypothetical protein D3C81_1598430 [compost metagenome]
MLGFFLLLINEGQSFQIVIEHLTFLIGQLQEGGVQVVQVVVLFFVAHLFHTVFHRGAAGTRGQVQLHIFQTYGLR